MDFASTLEIRARRDINPEQMGELQGDFRIREIPTLYGA